MESATVQTSSILSECRERVRAAQATRDNQVKRIETLVLQKAEGEQLVNRLEASRAEIITGIGKGTSGDADLVKLKKELNRAKDALQDSTEILMATEASLKQAERDLESVVSVMKAQELKAWRQASASLTEMHREDLQRILNRIYVATNGHEPGVIFWSLLNTCGLRVPTEGEYIRIRQELMEEFSI